jgi:hypothetical protein
MGLQSNPWDGMTYDDLAALAKEVLTQAVTEDLGSVERAMKMAAYDAIVNEFKRRVFAHVSVKFGLPPVTISDEALAGWKLLITDFPDMNL